MGKWKTNADLDHEYKPSGCSLATDTLPRTTRSKRKIEVAEDEKLRKLQPVVPPPKIERVEEDYGHTVFPNEIWDKILIHLSKKDLRSLSLVSKSLRILTNRLLWAEPNFKPTKHGLKGEVWETLLHLPIRKLRSPDFFFKRKNDHEYIAEILSQMPLLSEIEVCQGKWKSNRITMRSLRVLAPYVKKIKLDCVLPDNDCTRTEFCEELAKIDFPNLKSVTIPYTVLPGCYNTMHSQCGKEMCVHRVSRYRLEDFQLMKHLPITELNLNCLQPEYEVLDNGLCYFYPEEPYHFPQIPYLLQMKSLNTVVVNLFQAVSDDNLESLRELRDKNGVNLVLVFIRNDRLLEKLKV
uniref:F-box domain-containing protein n=1 Tax=Clytia hemisphaerica TaxID=252671 RepID=A0A7M5XH44_9CNID